jgi:phosphate-selective porin OprO/OprP
LIKACRRTAIVLLAWAVIAVLAAPRASAQGAFYREAEKDGRIYVFNIAKEFGAWEKSGEMGKAITKVGYGPNGETMVFDSIEAIHLYNFKHGRPGDAADMAEVAAPKPKQVFGWKDGKLTFETDKASITLTNRIQFRYTREMPDDANTLANGAPISGTAQPLAKGDSRDSFRLRRAKAKFEGWFWKKELTFEFQMNFADTASSLEDAQLTWDVSKTKAFQIKVGQYKVPFGRQELTSSGSQQFVDRSIVSNEFNKGRDAGVSVQGLLAEGKVDYRLGAFNGNQRNKAANDNTKFQYNGRVVFQPWGDVKYSESDFESTDKPLLAVGGQFESNDLWNTTTGVDTKRFIWGPEAVFKYKGFSLFADAYFRTLETEADNSKPEAPVAEREFDSDGFQIQAGYFLYKRSWEIAARYASWDPDATKDDNDRTEIGGAISFYENKHALKVQADVRQIEDKAKGTKDKEFRLQSQFIF